NARDAMDGSGTIQVRLGLGEVRSEACASCRQPIDGHYLVLSVTDNGPGIDAGVMERMFEPFFTTKEVGKGSGMGLATVHGIVHEYGGHVRVETRAGGGTSFHVLLAPFPQATGGADDAGEARVFTA